MHEQTQQELEKAGSPRDCMSCRVIGTVVPLTASIYLLASTYSVKPPQGAHRVFTLAFAGGFAALALTRAVI